MAKSIAREIAEELRITPQEFNWDNPNESDMLERIEKQINRASRLIKGLVGAANYNSVDVDTAASIKDAEDALSCSYMLRKRMVILSSRPEEAPPEEYIDLESLKEEIDRYEQDVNQILKPYLIADPLEDNSNGPHYGASFAFGSGGVDETKVDDYTDIDYGEIDG